MSARLKIEQRQSEELLKTLAEHELSTIAQKLSIECSKNELIPRLRVVPHKTLLAKVSKTGLQAFVKGTRLQSFTTVAELRFGLQQYWSEKANHELTELESSPKPSTKRTSLQPDQEQAPRKKSKPTPDLTPSPIKPERSVVARTSNPPSPQSPALRLVESSSPSSQYAIVSRNQEQSVARVTSSPAASPSNPSQLARREVQNVVQYESPGSGMVHARQGNSQVTNFSNNTCAASFVPLFYGILNGPNPNGVFEQNLFATDTKLLFYAYGADGKTILQKQEAQGIPAVQALLPIMKEFELVPGQTTEEFDEYGLLHLDVKGNLIHPGRKSLVGIFAHFFVFFQVAGKYVIKNFSVQIKPV